MKNFATEKMFDEKFVRPKMFRWFFSDFFSRKIFGLKKKSGFIEHEFSKINLWRQILTNEHENWPMNNLLRQILTNEHENWPMINLWRQIWPMSSRTQKTIKKVQKNHVLRRVYRFSSIFSDLSSLGALVKIWESFSENWPTPSRTRLTNRSGTDQRPGSFQFLMTLLNVPMQTGIVPHSSVVIRVCDFQNIFHFFGVENVVI